VEFDTPQKSEVRVQLLMIITDWQKCTSTIDCQWSFVTCGVYAVGGILASLMDVDAMVVIVVVSHS